MNFDFSLNFSFLGKPKTRDLSSLFRMFQSFIESGNGVSETLANLKTRNAILQRAIDNIKENVDDGMQLGEAFEKEDKILPQYAVSAIKAGSQTNRLTEALINIGQYLKYERKYERKIYSTIKEVRLNLILLCFMILFIMKFYLPQLQTSSSEQIQSNLIKMVLQLFLFMNEYFYTLMAVSAVSLVLLYRLQKIYPFMDYLLFKMPLYKEVYYYKIQYRITATMAMLLNIGLNNTEIMKNMAKSINNALVTEILNKAVQYNLDGMTLIEAIKKADGKYNLIEQSTLFHMESGEKNRDLKNQLIHATNLNIDSMEEAVEDYSKRIANLSICAGGFFMILCWIAIYGPYLETGRSYLNLIK